MAPKEEYVIDVNGDVPLGASCIIKEAKPQVIYFSACLHEMERYV